MRFTKLQWLVIFGAISWFILYGYVMVKEIQRQNDLDTKCGDICSPNQVLIRNEHWCGCNSYDEVKKLYRLK